MAEIVRQNNAAETSMEKVDTFLALNKLHKQDKETELNLKNMFKKAAVPR